MPDVQLGDVRLRYRLDGPEGAPVLALSNSLGTALAMWEPQVAALASRYRVLRYDARGHGASSVPAGPYSIGQMGHDVLALLDHLGIGRAHFCGLSMGGMVGLWLGWNAPSRLARLVLCNTAARIGPADVWNARIALVQERGMAAVVEPVLARWFTAGFLATPSPALDAARAMLASTPAEGYVASCAAVRDMDQREAISRIGVPTLVIAGAHDVVTTPADGRFMADTIPNARYVELDAPHISNLERPAEFTAALADFLA